ncbi:helix-turn-helix domain-containing protein [Microbispora amethystogenes]|uniref:HTH cro/C1-type domain-containing protein n=1 Tax=Microbispora amethystogenes TaxID=1427754 RepID=A0ABQ4FLJ5_9ACTN|nr:helix-turn-helix transcriptional regulator [Microbispora amethystogenes]GIH35665.1 hypothetical protein Mam01_58290 [Microbispora amethystogenes]
MPRRPDSVDPAQSPLHLLGAALRHWCDVRGMSLQEVGKAVFMDWSTLARWERGERRPPDDVIERLDRALKADGCLAALHGVVVANMTPQVIPAVPEPGEWREHRRSRLCEASASY